jgi:hypothetical protein
MAQTGMGKKKKICFPQSASQSLSHFHWMDCIWSDSCTMCWTSVRVSVKCEILTMNVWFVLILMWELKHLKETKHHNFFPEPLVLVCSSKCFHVYSVHTKGMNYSQSKYYFSFNYIFLWSSYIIIYFPVKRAASFWAELITYSKEWLWDSCPRFWGRGGTTNRSWEQYRGPGRFGC